MIDINKKLDKIEKNCYELAKREYKFLKEDNDNIISEKVLEKVNSYKEELTKKYTNEISKIEREYNRNLFDYEMTERVKVNEFKQNLKENINSMVESQIYNFIETYEYKDFLFRNIEKTLSKINMNECIEVYITEKDFYKFKDEIEKTFNVRLEKIENENIGGCVVIDSLNHISINNTLKTNIEEKIEKINL